MHALNLSTEPTKARENYLPPSEHPLRRVAESPAGCNSVELLAAQIGGAASH